ncbi:MAG: hypothetical protein JWM80_6309 [Cyanobacteria bacterium RYN_339]|nr:hypothetical protein [Cyanobacteria bacterium RYN_339]
MKMAYRSAMLLVALTGCAHTPPEDVKPVNVLFIGNSYTTTNDLPGMIGKLAEASDQLLAPTLHCEGGKPLKQQWMDGKARDAIRNGAWTWVVMQEQSQVPSFPLEQLRTEMYPSVRWLDEIVRVRGGARTLLYETWGHQQGDRQNRPTDTYEAMQERLNLGYETIAREQKLTVAPVGRAWHLVHASHPDLPLWMDDGSHPTAAGTYLAACVFYNVLFGRSPVDSPYLAGLDRDRAKILQQAAADSVTGFKL